MHHMPSQSTCVSGTDNVPSQSISDSGNDMTSQRVGAPSGTDNMPTQSINVYGPNNTWPSETISASGTDKSDYIYTTEATDEQTAVPKSIWEERM